MAGKADWKYNPLLAAGVSRANQEDSARATEAHRDMDDVYAGDHAAVVEALRSYLAGADEIGGCRRILQTIEHNDPLSHEVAFLTFADQWGFPALLRAMARACEAGGR